MSSSPLADIHYTRTDWRTWQAPTEADRKLRTIVEGWSSLPAQGLADIRGALSMDDFGTLMAFARRAMFFTVREGDRGWALASARGLAAVACDRVDWRDLTTAMAWTTYALHRLGLVRALEAAIARAEPKTRSIFERFASNPPTSLSEWGVEIVSTPRGPALVERDF